jgi:ribosomal protein S18 acetylase RimI-like enzyme
MDLDIRQASADDIPALYALYEVLGKEDAEYFEACFEKGCLILIASRGEQDIGFGVLNFDPKYSLYKRLGISEIQDLNVVPEAREQGAATSIVTALENVARDQGNEEIGICVALTKDYGPAQRLYVKLGYMPDGYGVTYDREFITAGTAYPVDDDLTLMMVKGL